MLSMDARPLYLRLLGEKMGVLTRGWKHITSATRSSFFPRVTQKPSIVNRYAMGPEMDSAMQVSYAAAV